MVKTNGGYLILGRHAESERNDTKRNHGFFVSRKERDKLMGAPDHLIPLTPLGKEQAQHMGGVLRERFPVPTQITHSGYRRTIETTHGILAAYTSREYDQVYVTWSHLIRERHAGYGFEMLDVEADIYFPWLQRYWKTWKNMFATPPGGESIITTADREVSFLQALEARFRADPTRTEFVIGHGIGHHALRFLIEKWTYVEADEHYKQGPLPNCGMVAYKYLPHQGFVKTDESGA